jgi:hypothetical protein
MSMWGRKCDAACQALSGSIYKAIHPNVERTDELNCMKCAEMEHTRIDLSEVVTQVILPPAFRVLPTHLEFLDFRRTQLIFQPIPKPAVNDLPLLVANRAKIEKVGPFILQVSEEQKAAHHAGFVWVLFRPSVVFAKNGSSCLFFLHACHADHPLSDAM